jgi:hypothetical protein
MENKLGSYINSLMTTIVDREEKWFVRGLAYNELTSLKNNINEVLINYDELGMIAKPKDEKDKDQLEFDFGKKQSWSEKDEERMNIVGQNGNDGLHYDEINNKSGENNGKDK